MGELLALAGFSFVSSVTPGPNNILLWASGAAFGFRRTLPHVLGTAVGLGSLAIVLAAGLGALITAVPEVATVMKLAGSIYLLWLAWQIARSGGLTRGVAARPLTLARATAFQWINPKAWIFALGAVTTFRPASLPIAVGSAVVALVMMTVIIPSAALWAGAGDSIGRLVNDPRRRRVVNAVLGLAVAATVVLVWV